MKDVTLNDLKRLVETLDNDAPIPKLETPQVFDEEIVEAAKEAKDNMFKSLLKEIEENENKITALEEEKKTLVEESTKYLPDLKEQQADPLLSEKVATLEGLQKQQKLLLSRLQTQLGSLGGGGEVRLEFLDDVDRDSVKVDGKYLQYQSSTGTFIGADASGGGGGDSDYASSAGIATFATTAGIATFATTAGVSTNAQGLTGTPTIAVTNITGVAATFTGNVSIAGTLTYDDVTNVDSVGIVTARSGVYFGSPTVSAIITNSATTTSDSQTSIDSFSASTYRSAKYQVQITRGSEYQVTEISIVHDGSDSYGTEYATLKTGETLSTFSTDISGGNVRLLATPSSSTSTVFKFTKTAIVV